MSPSKRQFDPEDLLDFIELPVFTRRWEKLELNDEGDLSALQLQIMENPRAAQVIRGTHGIRKLRYSPESWRAGKRGAARVLYVYFSDLGIVILALIYGKNEVDNISPAVKKYLNALIVEIERELRRRRRYRQN